MQYKYYKGKEDELNHYLKLNNKIKLVSASYEGNDIYSLIIAEDEKFNGDTEKRVKIFRGLDWELNNLQNELGDSYKVVDSEYQGMDIWSCLLSNLDLIICNDQGDHSDDSGHDDDKPYDPSTVLTIEIADKLYVPKNELLILDGGNSNN